MLGSMMGSLLGSTLSLVLMPVDGIVHGLRAGGLTDGISGEVWTQLLVRGCILGESSCLVGRHVQDK